MVDGLIEGELRNHLFGNPLGHVVGHDVGCYQLLRLFWAIGVKQLDDRLDWFKLNEIAVAHMFFFSVFLNFKGDKSPDSIVLVLWMPHVRVSQSTITQFTRPNRDYAPRVCMPLEEIQWV